MIDQQDLHLDPEAASEMASNAVVFYLASLGFEEGQEMLSWVNGVFEKALVKAGLKSSGDQGAATG